MIATISRLRPFLNPFHRFERWLLGHAPMIWAERYHLALFFAVAMGMAAMLLGFAQGSAVSYSLGTRLSIPLEHGLPAVPWCVAIGWWWSRAKGYGSLPLVKANYGLHYSLFDLSVLIVLLLIPLCYTAAFRAGLEVHTRELETVMRDEFTLKTAWRAWNRLATDGVPVQDIEREIRIIASDKTSSGLLDFSYEIIDDVMKEFPLLDDLSLAKQGADPLKEIGLVAANLALQGPGSRTAPAFLAERTKLENILSPLSLNYLGIDMAPYFAASHERALSAREAAQLKVGEDRAQSSFEAFYKSIRRLGGQPGISSIETQVWILFPVLLTLLAIPATTARVYWMTWALIMTGGVSFLYFAAVFSQFVTGRLSEILGYALLIVVAAVLLLALTIGKIGKHTFIKMLCVVVPLLLLILLFILLSKINLWSKWPYSWAALLVAGALSRLMFNRLRSLPDPY